MRADRSARRPARRTPGALLIDAGQARFIQRDIPGAIEHCAAAAALASRTDDAELLARACLALPEMSEPEWLLPLAAWCAQALSTLPDGDSSRRAQLLAQQAVCALFAGVADLDALSAAALAMARRLRGGPQADEALRRALRARQLACGHPQGHAERLVLGAEMIALGRRTGDLESVFWGHLWRFDARVQSGRIEQALAELDAAEPVVTRIGRPLPHWHLQRSRIAIEIGRARFAEANRLIAEATGQVPSGLTASQPYWASLLVARLTGDDRGIPENPVTAPHHHQVAPVASFVHVAPWHLAAGRRAEAAALLQALPELGSPRIPPFITMLVDAVRCLVTAELGELDAAEAAYAALLPHADLHAATGAGVSVKLGSAHLPLGVAALACGHGDRAVAHLRTAVEADETAGLPAFAALARYHLARASSSREEAVRAAASARRLGMAPLLSAATALLDEPAAPSTTGSTTGSIIGTSPRASARSPTSWPRAWATGRSRTR